MPSIDCPISAGSGYVPGDDDAPIICSRCEGTGVLSVDEGLGDALSDARD